MHHIKEELDDRIYNLKQIINKKEKELSGVPEGSIHICKSGNRTQLYLNLEGKRRYLKETETKLVIHVAQHSSRPQGPIPPMRPAS